MKIGIPREILEGEKRVAATPETVEGYIKLGFEVMVEAGAGAGVFIDDNAYRKAGATVLANPEDVFSRADIVLKVKQLLMNRARGKHEVMMMKRDSTLITFLHPASPSNHQMVKLLQEQGITSFTMDGIPRISRAQQMDALSSMSAITGYRVVVSAAERLPKFMPMVGTAIGMVKPANCLVIGAGVVGLQAVATAKRLGAVVQVFDIRKDAREQAQSLGAKPVGFEVPQDVAQGPGGYAKALDAGWLQKELEALTPLVAAADVVILSALVPGCLAPVLVTEAMVRKMAPGSVVMDVSIDQGGNCEITRAGEEYSHHGVNIYGIANIPGRMAVHATWLYSQNMYHFVKNLTKKGLKTLDLEDEICAASLVTYKGNLVFQPAREAMGQA